MTKMVTFLKYMDQNEFFKSLRKKKRLNVCELKQYINRKLN